MYIQNRCRGWGGGEWFNLSLTGLYCQVSCKRGGGCWYDYIILYIAYNEEFGKRFIDKKYQGYNTYEILIATANTISATHHERCRHHAQSAVVRINEKYDNCLGRIHHACLCPGIDTSLLTAQLSLPPCDVRFAPFLSPDNFTLSWWQATANFVGSWIDRYLAYKHVLYILSKYW